MKRTTILLLTCMFALASVAQNYPNPESFLAKIPAYPASAKNIQVIIDSLQRIGKAVQDAQKEYADAQKKIMATMDKTAIEQANKKLYQGMDSNKMKEMQKKQQDDMQSLSDTSKDGVAKRMKNFDKQIATIQKIYDTEVKKQINPIDSAIAAEMKKATDKTGTDVLSGLISKRTTQYQNIMNNFLIGDKAAFQALFKDYSEYLKGTLIPMLDRIKLDQTKIFNLTYTPHANALGAIAGYIEKYKRAIQNLRDYKEWNK